MPRSVTILGCRVDAIGTTEAVRLIVDLAYAEGHARVVTLGTEMAVRATTDARFREAVNSSSLSLCDTVGIRLAARANGVIIPERVTGIDLIEPLCVAFARARIGIYLLGGAGDTAERAAARLREEHPRLSVSGVHDGYFSSEDDGAVAAEIAESGARVVFVGLGSPRQELWLEERLKETGCAVGIGVGGSFDVLAGNVARAPALWRRFNLEWLYRLVQQPARWRRQLALPYFVWLVVRERARGRSTRRYW